MSSVRANAGLLLHGDRVGRYRILTHVADGGMAAVYLAELDGAMAFSKQVALKVIHRHLMADASFVKMFVDEARVAGLLHHPNIVQTFDLVQTDDHLAIAMEYAPGVPAAALSPQHSRWLGVAITPELVAYVGAEAAAGLHHAHTLVDTQGNPLGIVHRDVSPANIHIGHDGRVRVVDFGIAKIRGQLSTTAHGLVKGTFAYVPPEHFAGAEPTPQSDVWSLGVVLWELLAGRRLFRRDTEADTARAVLSEPVAPIETIRSDFPLALGIAVHRALERDPKRRWASAEELEHQLREILPAKLETVREPLLAALEPLRAQHFAELRALLEVEEAGQAEAADAPITELSVDADGDSVPVSTNAPAAREQGSPPAETPASGPVMTTAAVRHEEPTPMAATDLRALSVGRPRRGRVAASVGAVAVLGAVTIALTLTSGPRTRDPRPRAAHAPTAARVEAPPPPAAPEPPRRVSLDVSTALPDARVFLDGRALGSTPLRTLVPRDGAEHVLRVEGGGRSVEQRVTLDGPVQLVLSPPATATPAPGAPAPTPPAPRRWRKTLTFDQNVYR